MVKAKPSAYTPIEVDIVSDFVCPWCWLGYKQFLRARNSTKPRPNLVFRPYMLDPTLPDEGVEYKTYMRQKFGDKPNSQWAAMREHLLAEGPNFGIVFDFDGITRRPNTLGAHRLMRWAQNFGDQNPDVPDQRGERCAQMLFTAFLENGEDIGDIDVLVHISDELGMDKDITRDLLRGDEDKLAIQQEIQFFRGLGISGVPTFIYNGQYAVQGAQSPDKHQKIIKEAAANPVAV